MSWVPEPTTEDVGFNEPYTAELNDGEKVSVEYAPEQSGSTFYLPTLAISKVAGTVYELKLDGSTEYGPAAIPPTDIDDLDATFVPALSFETEMEVIVRNNSGTTNTYTIQPLGFERTSGGGSDGA